MGSLSTRGPAVAAVVTLTSAFLTIGGVASADPDDGGSGRDKHGLADTNEEVHEHQHGGMAGHLDPVSRNVEVVGKQKVTNRADKISDLTVLGDYAYLGEWAGGLPSPGCRGGVHVMDISNPADPEKVGFLPSHQDTYVTEGVHALHVETDSFTGDLLVLSNESCGPRGIGGMTIWDITDPLDPVLLSQGVGDRTDGPFEDPTNVDPVAHDSHSIMAWQDGDDVYAIAVDNDEDPNDLDFFEITDPAEPELIAETGIGDWPGAEVNAFGDFPTSHDFDVRFIDGHWLSMVSYWDAGWVLLNVDDPHNPTFINDSNYGPCEAHVPTVCPPEGEAHQGEWNEDGSLFIGTDEDLAPFRLIFNVVGGGAAGEYPAEEFSWTVPIASLDDQRVNGPVVFGGYGCPDDRASIPPASVLDGQTAPGEDQIIMFQRGPVDDPNHAHDACFFSEKVESAQLAGYDAVIVANHHSGAGAGAQPDATACGSQGHQFTVTIPGLCVGHRLMHVLFDRTPDYTTPYPSGDPGDLEPDVGDIGTGKIDSTSFFSGWGGSRLLNASSLAELDQFYIDEASDPEFATGHGDVDVHEVATGRGPDADLAYFAHYSGGIRVARFDGTGITEVGAFIDQAGNDLWGVQLTDKFTAAGDRIVAYSDRDYGLYLAAYTGP